MQWCFSTYFFYFISLFFKIIFIDFFIILSWLRIWFCNFFSLKHCWLLQCFFLSKIIFFFILFFNIELVKNYSYNMWGKHCNLFWKLLFICYSVFSHIVFFIIFFQIILFNFIFLILSCLWITITNHYK